MSKRLRIFAFCFTATATAILNPIISPAQCLRYVGIEAGGELLNLDPINQPTTQNSIMVGVIYNRLLDLDSDFEPSPELARSWESNPDATIVAARRVAGRLSFRTAVPRCGRCMLHRQPRFEQVEEHHTVACRRWRDVDDPVHDEQSGFDGITAPPSGTRLLQVENLECSYPVSGGLSITRKQDVAVVRAVSLDLAPQETFALVGESGSGKSTIAKAIAGLLPQTGGSIAFEDSQLPSATARRSQYAPLLIG
jgi:ABC-type multidrug transport system fused ATPase/permease subunit